MERWHLFVWDEPSRDWRLVYAYRWKWWAYAELGYRKIFGGRGWVARY